MAKLNQQFVRSVSEPGSYQDGRGLFLKVSSKGYKYWVLRFQLLGKRSDMILGSAPAMSLKDARLEADQQRMEISRGINPLEMRQQQKSDKRQAKPDKHSFEAEAASYIDTHEPSWSPRHARQWRQSLKKHVYPVIGSIHVRNISTDEALEVLKPIWLTYPTTASRIRNRIELVLDAAKAKQLREGENPARWRGHLDKLLPRQRDTGKAFPAMPVAEIPDFIRQLDAVPGTPARALSLLIFTGLRSGEIRNARWSEIDMDNRVWVIPAERMKAKKTHRVPLTTAMIEQIQEQVGLHSEWVFPGARLRSALAGNAFSRLMATLGQGEFVPHGFRSSFRTWAAEETNFPREICEMALAHQLAGKVEAAYYRGDQLEKRRELMQLWCDHAESKNLDSDLGILSTGVH